MYNLLVKKIDSVSIMIAFFAGFDFDDENSNQIPRFRDAYFDFSQNEPKLVLYTRTGGGNREFYEKENNFLRNCENFIEDFDDSFDSTYAHWVYSVPENYKNDVDIFIKILKEKGYDFSTPSEKFQKALDEISIS